MPRGDLPVLGFSGPQARESWLRRFTPRKPGSRWSKIDAAGDTIYRQP
jgi:hypothetical protein